MEKYKFLEKARNIHGYRYQYPSLNDKVMQKDIIEVLFDDILYKQRVRMHLKGNRPERKSINGTTEGFIMKSCKVWGDKYDYSLSEYVNSRTKIKIIYDEIVYEQYPNDHIKGCPVEGYLDQKVFILKAERKYGNKYDYSLVKFKNANTKVKIILNGHIYEQTPHNHLKYCPERLLYKTNDDFIKESNEIHDNKYNYDKTTYLNDRSKVVITCPKHGDFEQRPNHHLIGVGCPSCGESKGEKEISMFLNKYNIKFDRQKRFIDCVNIHPLRFDFYIPSRRTCIEFDGIQHYQPVEYFGGQTAYEKAKINDKIKNDYCEDNYINLIRIRWDQIDDIQQILLNNFK
jgi:very-short-patch-repair endonuclease